MSKTTMNRSHGDIHEIIILRNGGLGDFILTIPLFLALRQHHPQLPLTIFCANAYRPLLHLITHLLPLTTTVDNQSSLASSLLTPAQSPIDLNHRRLILFGSPDRELEEAWKARGLCHVSWIDPKPATPPWAAEHYCSALGLDLPTPWPPALTQAPLPCPDKRPPTLWIHPGSGASRKNMPPDYFCALIEHWQRSVSPHVILSFGEADLALFPVFQQRIPAMPVPETITTVVTPTLEQLIHRLRTTATCYVGNDSGISHLAAFLNIPAAVLFTVTDPRIWAPRGRVAVQTAATPPDVLLADLLRLTS